jgi:voltage-gated potassium channel
VTSQLARFFDFAEEDRSAGAPTVRLHERLRWLVLALLTLSIPAFYLMLAGRENWQWLLGEVLYAIVALGLAGYLLLLWRSVQDRRAFIRRYWLDGLILLGAVASIGGHPAHWTVSEWVLRLAFSAMVAGRLAFALLSSFAPMRLAWVVVVGGVMLALAGAGFYWLEPTVNSYADGLWLAFTSGATVGYGDIVPTTPESRVFAAFMVLLGFGILSITTAAFAALFIGEEEQQFQRELHQDIRTLRREVSSLRRELHALRDEGRQARQNPSEGKPVHD